MSPIDQAKWILLLPLIGFVIQILTGKKWPRQGDWIPTGAIGLACLLAWNMFLGEVLSKPGGIDLKEVTVISRDSTGHAHKMRGRLLKADDESITLESAGGHGKPEGHGAAAGLVVSRADIISGPHYTFYHQFTWSNDSMGVSEGWLKLGETPTPGRNTGASADLNINLAFLIDNLTAIMLVVVTTVSFLVHLYSTGYMVHHGHRAPRYSRFFAFLGLFSFSMLGLVMVDNLFFLFFFWELVGLCSYFLIGFEFEREAACQASIKAFITTKVGDCGFFIALMIMGAVVGSFGFADIFASVRDGYWEPWLLTLTAILLFIGPVGKSAQFPMHVWLPDAMEGPTPVSALIHAATMVVAGVYLIARMFPFFAGVPFFTEGMNYFDSTPLAVVAFVGGFTSLFAATIALVQDDLKKVLAYSTVSQLGYMVLAMGVGSISAGAFHLWTHAFFKGCMFLCAGSVIHAVSTNDMHAMGGLRKKMPITFYTFLIATMAISGVPLLSGFYSKEAILTQAFMYAQYRGGLFWLPFAMGMLTAVLTPFYMFRLICLTFMGKPNDKERYDHAHESPWNMTVPLIVLATLAVIGGGSMAIGSGLTLALAVFPFLVAATFFTRPYAKTLGAALLVFALVAGFAHVSGAAADHGTGGHGAAAATGHDGGHSAPKNEGTTQWFNNRVGNHLFTNMMAVVANPGMIHEAKASEHGGHASHGNLVLPPISEHAQHFAHNAVMGMSLICAALGIGFCWMLFLGPLQTENLAPEGSILAWYRGVLLELYYVDHVYWWLWVEGTLTIRHGFAWFDRRVIDGAVNWTKDALLDICGVAREVDQPGLGLAKGSSIMAGVFSSALVATLLTFGSYEHGVYSTYTFSEFGSLVLPPSVLCGASASVLLAIIGVVLMALGGIRKGHATQLGLLFAVSGLLGATGSFYILKFAGIGAAGIDPWYGSVATHPTAAAVLLVTTITMVFGVWTGFGVDGTVRFISETVVLGLGKQARRVQTGRLQDYLVTTIALTVVVLLAVALV